MALQSTDLLVVQQGDSVKSLEVSTLQSFLSDDYVISSGDNMSGNLTLGTNQIVRINWMRSQKQTQI